MLLVALVRTLASCSFLSIGMYTAARQLARTSLAHPSHPATAGAAGASRHVRPQQQRAAGEPPPLPQRTDHAPAKGPQPQLLLLLRWGAAARPVCAAVGATPLCMEPCGVEAKFRARSSEMHPLFVEAKSSGQQLCFLHAPIQTGTGLPTERAYHYIHPDAWTPGQPAASSASAPTNSSGSSGGSDSGKSGGGEREGPGCSTGNDSSCSSSSCGGGDGPECAQREKERAQEEERAPFLINLGVSDPDKGLVGGRAVPAASCGTDTHSWVGCGQNAPLRGLACCSRRNRMRGLQEERNHRKIQMHAPPSPPWHPPARTGERHPAAA